MKNALVLIVVILYPALLWSHPGGTDKQGGHACWRNCSEWELKGGEYHFHDEQGNPIRVAQKRSLQHTLPTTKTGTPSVQTPEEAPPHATVFPANNVQTPAAQATIEEPFPLHCSVMFPHSLALLLIALLLLLLLVRIHRRKNVR
ncbi:MAG: YHYH domain-containing protein [Nitrospirota bacterium]